MPVPIIDSDQVFHNKRWDGMGLGVGGGVVLSKVIMLRILSFLSGFRTFSSIRYVYF